jgi:hypothetical protein
MLHDTLGISTLSRLYCHPPLPAGLDYCDYKFPIEYRLVAPGISALPVSLAFGYYRVSCLIFALEPLVRLRLMPWHLLAWFTCCQVGGWKYHPFPLLT